MAFLGSLFDPNSGLNWKAQGTNIQQPMGAADYQNAIGQQQAFVNALGAQNGIGNQSNVFGQQQNLANMLMNQAQGGGPNPALQQLQNTTGQNMAQQAALMASQRGSSANTGLLARQAAMQGANIQQQSAGQAALMRAQQQLAAQGQLANQQQAMGNLATNQVGQQQQGNQNITSNIGGMLTGQNNANVGMQSNINNANAGIQQMVGKGQGGVLSAVGNMLGVAGMAAEGGEVEESDEAPEEPKEDEAPQTPAAPSNPTANMTPSKSGSFNNLFVPGQMLTPDSAMSNLGGVFKDIMPIAGAAAMMARGGSVGKSFVHEHLYGQKAKPMTRGGAVPGKASVKGDSYANDTQKILASPGEIVIPRHITKGKNPGDGAKKFVEAILARHTGSKK